MNAYHRPPFNEADLFFYYCLITIPLLFLIKTDKRFNTAKMTLIAFAIGYIFVALYIWLHKYTLNQKWILCLHSIYLLGVIYLLKKTIRLNIESPSLGILMMFTATMSFICFTSYLSDFFLIRSQSLFSKESEVKRLIFTEIDMVKLHYTLLVITTPYILWMEKRKTTTIISISLSLLMLVCFLWPQESADNLSLFMSFFVMFFITTCVAMWTLLVKMDVYVIPHALLVAVSTVANLMLTIAIGRFTIVF